MPAVKTFIVEDSPVIRENLVAALEEMTPVTVVGTAEDETTARGWLEGGTNDCDLVIIDIFLRKGSGLGVLQGLAAMPRSCKRVVLSNFATPDMRRRCLDLGADKVFDKSNEIDALIGYCIRLSEGGGDTEPGALRDVA